MLFQGCLKNQVPEIIYNSENLPSIIIYQDIKNPILLQILVEAPYFNCSFGDVLSVLSNTLHPFT